MNLAIIPHSMFLYKSKVVLYFGVYLNILNLTRKIIPKVSAIKAENIRAVNEIPEMVLSRMAGLGDKTIQKIGMNESKGMRILESGTTTAFTDGLNGCNGVLCVAKGLDGNPISILSHYTPLEKSRALNKNAIEKQLDTFDYYIDKNTKPKVFYNLPEKVGEENPIIGQLKSVFDKFFKQGYEEKIIPYETKNITPFDSKAMIAQYGKEDGKWGMKLTTVGEKEHNISLWG